MNERGNDWAQIMRDLVRGDRIAHVKVSGVIMGILGRLRLFDLEHEWDDICQEVLLKLMRSIREGNIRDASAFVGYCATVTRRESYRWIERRSRRAAQPLESGDFPDEDLRARDPELLSQVSRALEQLPEKSRYVMDAIYLRGYTYEEAADYLGMPLGTLKRAQTLALRELRTQLKDPD